MEWLFRSDFDALTNFALWSIAAVVATTIVLFVYTMGLRIVTMSDDRRRKVFVSVWRDVFASAMLSRVSAKNATLPKVKRSTRIYLLEEWNRSVSMVEGSAIENLIILAHRCGIPKLANKLMRRKRVQSQILAVQTLGHLCDESQRDKIFALLDHDNTALSIMAASALVDIDPDFAVQKIAPKIEQRPDWPKNRISILLRAAGSERISEPMYRAIRSADDEHKAILLQYASLMEQEALDELIDDLLRHNNDPRVINGALKLVSGLRGVPRIVSFAQHKVWFVRMQAAKVLGRFGQAEHLFLLEGMLDDPEWWVRYRAAQAITLLPFVGPNQLRRIRDRQTDPYATDILQHSMAEAGL